jgi:hypothetical protein
MSRTGQTGIFKDIATMFGIEDEMAKGSTAIPATIFPAKSRIALVGTVGAGKSSVVGGVGITSETLVRETEFTDNPFFCRVIEGSSEIHQDKSDLRAGHFPKKTAAYVGFASEAGLLLEWEKKYFGQTVWHKYLQVPICDLAGEDIEQLIRQVANKRDIGEYSRQKVRNLIAYMQESDGFVICLKGTRAKGFKRQLEPEKDPNVSADPDVNMVRLLDALMQYKMTNSSSRPIRGVAVILTASDILQRELGDEIGFNLLDPKILTDDSKQNDLKDFIAACFPATYGAIVSLRVPNVKFFPSFFEVEVDTKGNIQYWEEEPDSPKIKLREIKKFSDDWRHNLRKISYSEQAYIELINWLRNFAASA